MSRSMIRVSLFSAALAFASTAATAQETWQAYDYTEEDGQPVALLIFGVPETDSTALAAYCRPAPRTVEMELFISPGPLQAGDSASVGFTTPRYREGRPAVVQGPASEEWGPTLSLVLDRNDGLWEILMSESSASIGAGSGPAVDIHLRGSRAAISQFLRTCDAIWSGSDPSGGAQALAGPLFTVEGQPVEATTQEGAPLPPFAPGTELMASGLSTSRNGVEWVEVATERGAGSFAWVQRAQLTPSSGGAAEYRNLNQAASLLLRASPAGNAAVVGSVPPNVTGILDQGQRQGSWVLVRYGATTGWASHDYLLPIVPATAAPDGSPAPAPYRATHGDWQVTCDPCASYEDPVCTAWTGSLTIVADDLDPARIADLRVGMDLPGEPVGTLTVTVDGQQVASIPPADLAYMGMTGEFLLEQPHVDSILTAMAQGNLAGVTFAASSGQSQSFTLPLADFPAAVSDLLANSPAMPRDAACRFDN